MPPSCSLRHAAFEYAVTRAGCKRASEFSVRRAARLWAFLPGKMRIPGSRRPVTFITMILMSAD